MLHELQELMGHLNFACRVVALNQAFVQRLCDAMAGLCHPQHRTRITKGIKEDLQVWEFIREQGYRELWPIPVDHLLHFCVFRRAKGVSVATIKGDLSALAFSSRGQGVPEKTGGFQVRKMLKGWALEGKSTPDKREPFSPSVLRGLKEAWSYICISLFKVVLFHFFFFFA